MCIKFIVHSKKEYKPNNDYEIVTFSVRLKNNGFTLIPRLKYRRVFRKTLTVYNNGCTGYDEIKDKEVKDPLLTRIIHFINDRLKYGKSNFILDM